MIRLIACDVAAHAIELYDQLDAQSLKTEGGRSAIGANYKGMRVLNYECSEPSPETPKGRLGKGEIPGQRKRAVAAIEYPFDYEARSLEDIGLNLLLKCCTLK